MCIYEYVWQQRDRQCTICGARERVRHKVLDATVTSYARRRKGSGNKTEKEAEDARANERLGETRKGKEKEAVKGY